MAGFSELLERILSESRQVKPPEHLSPTQEREALLATMDAQARAGAMQRWEINERLAAYEAQKKQVEERAGPGWFQRNLLQPIARGLASYRNWIGKPVAELATVTLGTLLPGGADVASQRAELQSAYKAGGLSAFWKRLSEQRDERQGYFWGEKLMGEILLDPLNLVGFGLLGKIPIAGKVLGPAEQAYVKFANGVIGLPAKVLRQVPVLGAPFRLSEAAIARGVTGQLRGAFNAADSSFFTAGTPNKMKTLFNRVKQLAAGTVEPANEWEGVIEGVATRVSNYTAAIGGNPSEWFDNLMTMQPEAAFRRLSSRYMASLSSRGKRLLAERAVQRETTRNALQRLWDGRMGQTWEQVIQPWLLRGPAEMMLMFLNYMPFNILEDGVRSALGGALPRTAELQSFRHIVRGVRSAIPSELMAESKLADITRMWEGLAPAEFFGGKLFKGPLKYLGRWQLDMSSEWSTLIRRGYIDSRFVGKHLPELLAKAGLGQSEQGKVVLSLLKSTPNIPDAPSLGGLLRPGINRQLQEYGIASLALGGGGVREVKKFFAASQLNTRQLASLIGRHQWLSPTSRKLAREAIEGGLSADNLSMLMGQITDAERTFAMHQPSIMRQVIQEMRDSFAELDLSHMTRDDWVAFAAQSTQMLDQVRDVSTSLIHAYAEKTGMTPGHAESLWNQAWASSESFLDAVVPDAGDGLLDDILERLNVARSGIDEDNTLGLVMQRIKEGRQDLRKAIREDRAFRNSMFSQEGKRTHEFWVEYAEGRTDIWDRYLKVSNRHNAALLRDARAALEKSEVVGTDPRLLLRLQEMLSPEHVREMAEKFLPKQSSWEITSTRLRQLEQDLHDTLTRGLLTDKQQVAINTWIDNLASAVDELAQASPATMERLRKAMDDAWDLALSDYHTHFTNYDETAVLDDVMINAYPFWRYESRAWPWLLRQGLSKPVLGRTFMPTGYYWEYTDSGYMQSPLTVAGMQFAPIRGTVLGRLRRAYRGDYPTQHSGFVGNVEKAIQNMERWGFYLGPLPGVLAESTMAVADEGIRGLGRDFGEWQPPIITTLVNALIAGGGLAEAELSKLNITEGTLHDAAGLRWVVDIQNKLFENRYRDYYENIAIASLYGKVPSDVRDAAAQGDEDAKEMLLAAQRAVAWRTIVGEQLSLTRFRPQEYDDMRAKVAKRIEELTGISPEAQREITERGQSISDAAQLNRMDRAYLAELQCYEALASITEPLRSDSQRKVLAAQQQFYDILEGARKDALAGQQEDDAAFIGGPMSSATWRANYGDRWAFSGQLADALKRSAFSDVPLTLEERAAFAEAQGWHQSAVHAIDYIIDAYYNVPLNADPETGDWDWSSFFRTREEILDSLPPDTEEQVRSFLGRHETPLMREFRAGREFMQYYWDVETWLPRWYRSMGMTGRASRVEQWFKDREAATREYNNALKSGVDSTELRRQLLSRPEFSALNSWIAEYRAILRDPRTSKALVRWADPRIGAYYNKFFAG